MGSPKETIGDILVRKVPDFVTEHLRSRDLGNMAGKALAGTLQELGAGIQRLLTGKIEEHDPQMDAQDRSDLAASLGETMAKKLAVDIVAPELQGKTLITAPAALRDVAEALSSANDKQLEGFAKNEIADVVGQGQPAKKKGKKAADPDLNAAPDPAPPTRGTQPRPAPQPRPQVWPTPSPSPSWGGKYGSGSSRNWGGK